MQLATNSAGTMCTAARAWHGPPANSRSSWARGAGGGALWLRTGSPLVARPLMRAWGGGSHRQLAARADGGGGGDTLNRDDTRSSFEAALSGSSSALDNVSVVLCQPQGAGNCGSVARIMQNFGLRSLHILKPGPFVVNKEHFGDADNPHCYSPEATAMAVQARWMLDECPPSDDLDGILEDATFVIGTTARSRQSMPVLGVREAAKAIVSEAQRPGGKVAILFGNERHGLTSDELKNANACVALRMAPAPPEADRSVSPSLNLSSAAAVIIHEVFEEATSQAGSPAVAAKNNESGGLVSVRMRLELVRLLMGAAHAVGYLRDPASLGEGTDERALAVLQRERCEQQLQRVFTAGVLYSRDVKPLFSISRSIIAKEEKPRDV